MIARAAREARAWNPRGLGVVVSAAIAELALSIHKLEARLLIVDATRPLASRRRSAVGSTATGVATL
jgi:hypothetical protein